MKKRFGLLLLLPLLVNPALADEPSDAEVHQLLAAMHVERSLEQMQTIMSTVMRKQLSEDLNGQPMTAAHQASMQAFTNSMLDLVKEEITWTKMEPIYTQIYREVFTEDEIKTMLTFYSSPAGQALVAKQPLVIQKTMLALQPIMADMRMKMARIVQDAIQKKLPSSQPAPASAPIKTPANLASGNVLPLS